MLAKREVVKIFESIGMKNVENYLEVPPSPEFGNLAFACFELAKIERRSPKEVAEGLVKKMKLPKNSLISKIEAKTGYVNFFFDYTKMVEMLFY